MWILSPEVFPDDVAIGLNDLGPHLGSRSRGSLVIPLDPPSSRSGVLGVRGFLPLVVQLAAFSLNRNLNLKKL